MSSLDESVVRHIAHLSRLALTEEETALYTTQMARVLEYASSLPELVLEGLEETPLRTDEDLAHAWPDPEGLLINAVARQGDSIKVSAILDKSEGQDG